MRKSIIMIVAALGILSCGTMSNPDNSSEIPSEVASLASSLRIYERSLPSLPQPSTIIPLESEVKSCTNGGTMYFTNDYNQTQIIQNLDNYTLNLTSQASNCLEDGILVNGSIAIKIISIANKPTSTSTFVTDFSVKDETAQMLVKKGSFIISETLDDNTEIVTKSADIITNNSRQKTLSFKAKEFTQNDNTSISNISGRKIIDGKTFIVDESFNHALAPMVYDRDENLQIGGKQRYKNDENHTIMMEAVDINTIKISVDKDGDGKAEDVKTVKVLY